jgi:hypothetical protein
MWFSLVSSASPLNPMTRRVIAGSALIAIGYVAALVTSPATELTFGTGIGHASTAKHAVFDAGRTGQLPSPAAPASPQTFDYFPGHYVNQAREVAEQPPTF